MTPLEEYEQLARDLERWKREEAKAQGALERELSALSTHGVETEEEARKLLRRLEKQAAQQEEEFVRAHKEFRRKWQDKLSG